MTLTPKQRALVSRAKRYPFARPRASYLFVAGEAHRFHRLDGGDFTTAEIACEAGRRPLADWLGERGLGDGALSATRVAVLASGSNASPARLAEKYAGAAEPAVIPVVRSRIHDFAPVFAARFSGYGSITATLQHAPGCRSELHVTHLTRRQLSRMHDSEGIGEAYHFARLNGVAAAVADGAGTQAPLYAYLGKQGALSVEGAQFAVAGATVADAPFSEKTEEEILTIVWRLLDHARDFDRFIHETVADRAVFRRRNEALKAHSAPFAFADVEIIDHDLDKIF